MKRCTKCNTELADSEFHRKGTKLRAACKGCTRAQNLAAYYEGPRTGRQQAYIRFQLKRYGLDPVEYDAMFSRCGGKCEICRRPMEPMASGADKMRVAHIDHCHVTGAVRGLLCHACNTAIGKLNDDPAVIRRAADYVEGRSK